MSKNFVDNSNATNIITKIAQNFARLKSTMTRSQYEDAQTLAPGVYPIEAEDDSYVLSSDMVGHGNGTVEQALDGLSSEKADKADLANYLKIDITTYGTQTNYVHDFNDITTTGNYWCYCKYNDTQNQPAGTGTPNGVLMVTGTGDGITQLYIDRTNNRIYSRTYRASWSAWGTVALTSDLSQRSFAAAFAPISGQTYYGAIAIERYGKVRTLQFNRQAGVNHPGMISGICLPNTSTPILLRAEDRPRAETRCGLITYRAGSSSTSGLVNGKYYPCLVRITTSGGISIEGLTTDEILNIQDSSAYLVGTVTYIAK